jgi:hypothetical protein
VSHTLSRIQLQFVTDSTDEERRARLGVRHALARSATVRCPEGAARAVVCLHATDPPSVHLSCWARVDDLDSEWLDGQRVFTVYPSPAMQPDFGQ